METFSTLLALSKGTSPVTPEFPSQRPVTRSFDVFFDLRLNKRLSKQSRHRWRHCKERFQRVCKVSLESFQTKRDLNVSKIKPYGVC